MLFSISTGYSLFYQKIFIRLTLNIVNMVVVPTQSLKCHKLELPFFYRS